jgi:hypothetical protein
MSGQDLTSMLNSNIPSQTADILKNLVQSNNQFFNRTDEVNELLQHGNKAVACGPNCQSQQTKDGLYQALQGAITNQITAPAQVTVAEKNYFTYLDGPAGYDKFNKSQLEKKGESLANEMNAEFEKNYKHATVLNSDYDTTFNNSIHAEELYERYVTENKKMEAEIKRLGGDIFTNDRRTYYEDQEISGLKWWYYFMALIYGILLASFLLAGFFVASNPAYTLRWKIGIFLGLAIYPFLCTPIALYLIRGWNFFISFFPKNVYL